MIESQFEQLTQLLAEGYFNTDNELDLLINHSPDRDHDSSTWVGPTGQARFIGTESTTMAHDLTEDQHPRDPHGKEAVRDRESPGHAVASTVSLGSDGGFYAVANAS